MEKRWKPFLKRVNEVRVENGMWELDENEFNVVRAWTEDYFKRGAYYDATWHGEVVADVINEEINFLPIKIENLEKVKKLRSWKWIEFFMGVYFFTMLIIATISLAMMPGYARFAWVLGAVAIFAFAAILHLSSGLPGLVASIKRIFR